MEFKTSATSRAGLSLCGPRTANEKILLTRKFGEENYKTQEQGTSLPGGAFGGTARALSATLWQQMD
jgi:hypothetical protein